MEQPCYKCGASVEEGVPFCPQCNAPQIRVMGPEGVPAAETLPEVLRYPSLDSYASLTAKRVDWPQALRCAIMSGAVSTMLIPVPLGAVLGMLFGGSLCVVLYRKRTGGAKVTPGLGMQLGAVSGVIAFLLFALVAGIESRSPAKRAELHTQLVDIFQQQAARRPGPATEDVMNWIKTPDGFTFILALCAIVLFVFFVLFSGTGGAIAAALLPKKDRP